MADSDGGSSFLQLFSLSLPFSGTVQPYIAYYFKFWNSQLHKGSNTASDVNENDIRPPNSRFDMEAHQGTLSTDGA
jgi:hypothetical protein